MISRKAFVPFLILLLVAFSSCAPIAGSPSESASELPAETRLAATTQTPPVSATSDSTATPILSSKPEAVFESCGKGEPISEALTTGDLELFFSLQPDELLNMLGTATDDYGFVDDLNIYCIVYDSPAISLHYTCEFTEELDEKPILPLKRIILFNFHFRGLSESSDYDDVRLELGDADLLTIPVEDTCYYALRYKFGSLFFDFTSEDETGSDGLGLEVVPMNIERVA
jgi:hypothetical protein